MVLVITYARTLTLLNVSQNLRFHKSVATQLEPIVTSTPIIANVFLRYKGAIFAANKKFMHPRAAPQTPEMHELDIKRDGLFLLIEHAINDKLKYSINEDVKKAAKNIKVIMDKYAEVEKHEMEDETESIIKMCDELLLLPLDLDAIGIINDVHALRVINVEFQTLYEARSGYKHDDRVSGASYKMKAVMNAAFSDLVDAIHGQQLVVESEEKLEYYDRMASAINAIIEQFTIILHHHQAINKNNANEEDDNAEDFPEDYEE